MKKILAVSLMAVLFGWFPVAAFAAGTCVRSNPIWLDGQSVVVYSYLCTADAADGSFPATLTDRIDGWILSVETVIGTVAPTALWDVTLVDGTGTAGKGGRDVMKGLLVDRSATAKETVDTINPRVYGPVNITATGNSVNSAVFTISITVLR